MTRGMVCFSGGKDSTAMLLRMLEMNDPKYPVNKIVFSDTGFEFPELYEYLDRVQLYLDEHYPHAPRIEKVKSKKKWEEWFYGQVQYGDNEGKTRGAPLVNYPCWWSRESKVYPLNRAAKADNIDHQYVGIAWDELSRVSKNAEKDGIRYPLVEWKWTEEDCMAYLDHLHMGLSLYKSFTRLGCFHCIKQPPSSWYQIWKNYPDQWEISLFWDNENLKNTGRFMSWTESLADMQAKFEKGWIPKSKPGSGLECRSCDAVSLYADGTMRDDDFDTDDALERDERYMGSEMDQVERSIEADKTEWIPPSHLRAENVCAPAFETWFCEEIPLGSDVGDDE